MAIRTLPFYLAIFLLKGPKLFWQLAEEVSSDRKALKDLPLYAIILDEIPVDFYHSI